MNLLDRYTPSLVAHYVAQQQLLHGAEAGATALASVIAETRQFEAGEILIKEGAPDDSVYLLLAGSVRISVKGDLINFRQAGDHIGEMALVLGGLRTATATAEETTIAARLEGKSLRDVANAHPRIWENIARVLARRLDERKRFIRDPNPRPYVFIGSSGIQKDVATLIKDGLTCPDIECEVWSEPLAFPPGDSFLDTLLRKANKADFAIILFGRDDRIKSKGITSMSPRDNVLFEAGMFMGAIGKKRTFVVKDQKADLKMLSDLDGNTVLSYTKKKGWWPNRTEIDVTACCAAISAIINDTRVR